MTQQTLGILLMIATTFVFAVQDGLSRHLSETYPVMMVVMIRYWFFALFVLTIAARAKGGLKAAARSNRPFLQIFRGVLLAAEICVAVQSFVWLGLVEAHAIFACYPLIIAALSGPVLGEKVGWRRWTAVGVGFCGILVILRPGFGVFTPASLMALASALMFALYGLLTRYASRYDTTATSFFYTGTTGAVVMTAAALWQWTPMTGTDWLWMGSLCLTGVTGHWLLIKTYEVAEASAVQPFAYFQLVFSSIIGVLFWSDILPPATVVGAAIVVSAGLFTLWRERQA
ncbi:DMT family transporter [Vannielia litorea]|uniref:DMT family transporter n=1 Tax=Vannielia TaxID=2813041 RepID=UPI001C98A474|nr:DMT family transporter [Vannielia litorea]MBY6154295.1 DMT family transporter [Vannielia litorea]